MTTLNFPTSPSVGDIYSFNGKQWEWNGSGWALVPVTTGVSSLNGMTGDVVLMDGGGVEVAVLSGNVISLTNTGVLDVNGMAGQVTLEAGSNVTITPLSGNVIQIASTAVGGVESLNSMTGPLTLQAGANITITPQSGGVLLIESTGGGGTINGMSGDVTVQGAGSTTVTVLSGNVLQISSSASGGGVDSLNSMVGDVTLQAGSGISLAPQSGNVILISSGANGDSYGEEVMTDSPLVFLRFRDGAWLNAGQEYGSLPGIAGTTSSILLNQTPIVANAGHSRTVRFNATSCYFGLNGCGTIMSNLTRSFSVDFWIKTGSALTGPYGLISMGAGGWYIRVSSSQIALFNSGLGTVGVTQSGTLSTNTVYHIGFTIGAGTPYTLTLYINGVSNNTSTSSTSFTGNSQKYIGADNGPSEYATDLSIAEIAYYASVLSGTRMLAHYNAGI